METIYLVMKRETVNNVSVHSVEGAYVDYDYALLVKTKKEKSCNGCYFVQEQEVNEGWLTVKSEDEDILLIDGETDEVVDMGRIIVEESEYPVGHNSFNDSITWEREICLVGVDIFGMDVTKIGFVDLHKEIEHEADNYVNRLNDEL